MAETRLGTWLRGQREKMELSLKDVAGRMPITAGTIGSIESGDITTPSVPVLRDFARIYNTSLERLQGMLPAGANPAARVASSGKEIKEEGEAAEPEEKSHLDGQPDAMYGIYIPVGVTSFEDLDAAIEAKKYGQSVEVLTQQLKELIDNIMFNPDIEDKAAAVEEVSAEFARRIREPEPGKAASAARWQPLTDAVVGALQGFFSKQQNAEIPDSIKEAEEFAVWKEADGTYRWFAIFSNKYRDADHPPEILSEASHKEFEQALDSGAWPYPDLYAGWHVPFVVGKADMVAYVDGFQTASGTYHKGMEWAAEAHMKATGLMVSHGMPRPEIERDEKDTTILTRYRSKEISPLPDWAAANKLTGFQILSKEDTMAGIPEHKRDWFAETFGAEGVQKIEAGLQSAGKAADDAGVESKEAAEETKTEGEAQGDQAQPETVTVADLKEILVPIVTNITTLAKAVEALNAQVAGLNQSAEDQALKTLQMTPAASLKELVAGLPFNEQTQVDGRTSFAKDKPTTEQGQSKYGQGFVANLLDGFDELNDMIGQQ